MTFKDLYSLYYIEQEIADYKAKIMELREIATSMTPNYSGMPSGGGIKDKVGDTATTIAHYTNLLEKAVEDRLQKEMQITRFILDVDDAQLRRIMYLRFIKQLSWRAVALKIGGRNTADGVRKRCNRYVREHEKEKLSDLSA